MKIWISKNAEVSVREQIVTQMRLGVATRDLLPGEKLPSTRELARRFNIHANTVSGAYRELASEGLVEFRKGSGVFVAEPVTPVAEKISIDGLLADFISSASAAGFGRAELEAAMDRWRSGKGRKVLTLVESDPGLREILEAEIREIIGFVPASIDLDQFLTGEYDNTSILAALYDEKERMQSSLEAGQTAVFINANSVPQSLMGTERPDKSNLIAIVSGWQQFLLFARVYLVAARIDPEALLIRSTAEPGWQTSLRAAAIIICDSLAAKHFNGDPRLRVFRLVTDASAEELKYALR